MARLRPGRIVALGIVVGLLAACSLGTPSRPAPLPMPTPSATPAAVSAAGINLAPDIQARIADTGRVVFLVPFSHWDTDWHDTFESYAAQADRNILDAIHAAQRDPRFRFTFEQVLFVQHFWATHPEERADLTALVRARQLTFAWGGIVQPETSLATPAVQLRNLQLGEDWITQTFGIAPPRTAWQSDAFGNSAALPIILDQVRVPYLFMGRITNLCAQRPCTNPLPHAFYWASPADPTRRVLATYLTYSAALGAIRDKDAGGQIAALRGVIDQEAARTTSKYLFLPLGDDFSGPFPDLPALVDRWNAADHDTLLVMADPETAFDYLATQDLPQFTVDRNPVWQGFYGTRPAAKIADMESDYLLTAADKFGALLDAPPAATDGGPWQIAATNAHYDNISAVGFDSVWERSQGPRFAQAVEEAGDSLAGILARIASGVPAPLLLFNPSSWSRAGVIELRGALPDDVLRALPAPSQRTGPDTTAIWTGALPAIGFAAPTGPPGGAVPHPVVVTRAGATITLSNGLSSVTIDGARGGAFAGLAAAGGPELLAAPGDDLTYLDDNGDVYGANFGQERARESQVPAELAVLADGPLLGRVRATFMLGGQPVVKTIILTADSPLVGVTLDIAALPESSALVQTPTTRNATTRTDDLGVAAFAHPVDDSPIVPGTSTYRREVFYPITAWGDVSADGAGLTIITHGLQGLGGTTTLNLLLLRQVSDGGRADSEGLTDPGTHTLRYAYLPHAGDATAARPWLAAAEFNQPIIPTWRIGDQIAVQLPPLGDQGAPAAARLLPLDRAAPAFAQPFGLLAAENGIVADLYRRAGHTEAIVIDYAPGTPAALVIGGRRTTLPAGAFTISTIDLPPPPR